MKRPAASIGVSAEIFSVISVTTMLIGLAISVALSMYLCDGYFFYSLDDAYIHLSVARNIIQGGYGINAGEPSSPSSSILWPWLLSITESLGLGSWGPLLLSGTASVLSAIVGTRLIVRFGFAGPGVPVWMSLAMAALIILTTSAIALPLTGMEHAVHVLTVLLVLEGLVSLSEGGRPGRWFWIGIVLMPLIRFEGVAFAGFSLLAAWCLGYRRAAVFAGLAILIAVAAYAVRMRMLGLHLLPSSVLLKSGVLSSSVGEGSFLTSLAINLFGGLLAGGGVILLVSLAFFMSASFKERTNRSNLTVYLPAIGSVIAHLVGGKYNWFFRYEVYVMTIVVFGVLFVLSRPANAPLQTFPHRPKRHRRKGRFFLALAGLVTVFPYLVAIAQTPFASLNLYEQQYQMRRFAQDFYRGAVAVNDLGLVSYGNNNFVLDLWGLGSERVRKLRMANAYDASTIEQLVSDHGIFVVMIYDKWFEGKIPASWSRIAMLRNMHKIVAAYDEVSFYITNDSVRESVSDALRRLRAEMPAGASLQILSR